MKPIGSSLGYIEFGAGHHGNTAINQCEIPRTAGYNELAIGLYALYIIV